MTLASLLLDPNYPSLKNLVLDHTGLHYYATRDEDLAARLVRRMRARNAEQCHVYMKLLETDHARGGEWDALAGELTIGETYFFRQSEHFDLLRHTILPDLFERNENSRKLRIWSAGCATGAEPYSISLLLHLDFGAKLKTWDVSVLATDINPDFLAQARTGRFGDWALRDTPEWLKQCCFQRDGKSWILSPQYRERVRFEYVNLASNVPYPGSTGEPIDLIFCRNVLIYFSFEQTKKVAQRLHDSLAPGGWLLVGHAEPNNEIFTPFEIFTNGTASAYRRRSASSAPTTLPSAWPVWLPRDTATLPWASSPARPTVMEPPAVQMPRTENRPVATQPTSQSAIEDARAFADAGDWEAAERIARAIIEENTLDAAAHFTLGLVQEHHDKSAEAIASHRRAIYLNRDFALAHFHLGALLQGRGENGPAQRAFQNVIELLRTSPEDDVVPHGDGIRARELSELAAMHLEISKQR